MPKTDTDILNEDSPVAPSPSANKKTGGFTSIAVTVGIIIVGIAIVALFQEDINAFGMELMERYGQERIDLILFLLTAISCSPICLPVWGYVLTGVAMGYDVVHLAAVMALGSGVGSLITYYIGRYFATTKFVQKRFPTAVKHPWIEGRSRKYVTLILFFGTASPIPCDVFYLACGIKRYPALPFFIACIGGRFVRYLYLGYGFDFFSSLI